ncbi:MAG: hypothetical protein AAB966_00825, partial [Patescibacteria group bacterium]
MGRKYGVSVISLVPHSLGSMGLQKSLDTAICELGLDGIQALPMRGWSCNQKSYEELLPKNLKELVISFESSWNYGTAFQALKRRFGFGEEGYPTFLDLYLFDKESESILRVMENIFGWDKYISHTLRNSGYRYMAEIGPDNVQIQNYVDYKHGLVWDTWHVREKYMPD